MTTVPLTDDQAPAQALDAAGSDELVARLEQAFGQTFAILDASRGSLERVTADWPRADIARWLPLCEHIVRHGRVEVIEDHAPLLLLAVPLPGRQLQPPRVALAVLLTEADPSPTAIESAAWAFGVDAQRLAVWAAGRRPWPAYAVLPLATTTAEAYATEEAALLAKRQLSDVSSQLLATFDELNLLHQLTEWLSLGRNEHDLVEQAVEWLGEIVPSDCVVGLLGTGANQHVSVAGRESPIAPDKLPDFFTTLGPQAESRALTLNRDRTSSPTWSYPEVREVVTAPIVADGRVIGWLAAFNYRSKRGLDMAGFGTVEASLLSSIATLMGVHAGNRTHFDQQTRLFNSLVQAMTSAIDAKDRYTCGHSDRVARIAVRLARELGCSSEEVNTVYLGGLLHDVGKIGVDDAVLRKPDDLTEEEYEQIKTHPTLGERILRGVPHLEGVLPIVLHHHESWDGSGYPGGLVGESCPLLARITAVADSIDAMGSDRPYRKGIPVEQIEQVLLEGAGKQWDPAVVEAYFAARDDVHAISRVEREPLDLDVGRWAEEDACIWGS